MVPRRVRDCGLTNTARCESIFAVEKVAKGVDRTTHRLYFSFHELFAGGSFDSSTRFQRLAIPR